MTFGDPHYKTFDGKIYTFPGIGRYQLTSDCTHRNFSVRVANVFQNKNTKTSTLTRRVAIKSGKLRINLGKNLRTKVNGQIVDVPYKIDNKLVIEKRQDEVLVNLLNGIKILWTGKSFLEITVPASLKNHLCGLCGNFNSNVQDDLKVRKGAIVGESEILAFGSSWCVGSKLTCSKQAKQTAKIRHCKGRKMEKNPCKLLMNSELFNGCDSKLNYNKYYKACTMDMCDCPHGNCYCESFMAYARECERLGVVLRNWKKETHCAIAKGKKNKIQKTSYTKDEIELLLKQRRINRTRSERPPLLIQ